MEVHGHLHRDGCLLGTLRHAHLPVVFSYTLQFGPDGSPPTLVHRLQVPVDACTGHHGICVTFASDFVARLFALHGMNLARGY